MTLTKGDLDNLKDLFKVTLDEDETLVRKDDISHLPSKDDFFGKMDEVMGELKTVREEQSALSGMNEKLNDQEERIDSIEEKLQIQTS